MTFDDPSVQQYLSTKDIVILGTINPDGAPLVTAMWFLHDPSALTLISMDGLQKVHNLRRDPRLHILAESGARGADIKGVAIRGRAEFLGDTPERRALALQRCRGGAEHPGAALNAGALFRIPVVAASSHPLAPAALGAAEGAYDLFTLAMAKRSGTYTGARVADLPAVQIKLARARCLIDSARELLRGSAIAFQAIAERGEAPDLETKLRFRAHSAFAVNQAREAVETLWSCYGAQGLYTRDPLQRHLRDVLAINQHFSFNFDIAGAAYGAFALGGPYASPTM